VMDASSLVVVIQSAILLGAIWAVLFWPWSSVRLDCFRQQVFTVRDELFDYAASGKISFDHPAYRLLRQSMNGFIRYGHKVSFWQSTVTWIAWRAASKPNRYQWESQWQEALKSLDDKTRADLLRLYTSATRLVTKRIVYGSPVLLIALCASAIAVVLSVGLRSASDVMSAALSRTAEHAVDQRILNEEAARAAA